MLFLTLPPISISFVQPAPHLILNLNLPDLREGLLDTPHQFLEYLYVTLCNTPQTGPFSFNSSHWTTSSVRAGAIFYSLVSPWAPGPPAHSQCWMNEKTRKRGGRERSANEPGMLRILFFTSADLVVRPGGVYCQPTLTFYILWRHTPACESLLLNAGLHYWLYSGAGDVGWGYGWRELKR